MSCSSVLLSRAAAPTASKAVALPIAPRISRIEDFVSIGASDIARISIFAHAWPSGMRMQAAFRAGIAALASSARWGATARVIKNESSSGPTVEPRAARASARMPPSASSAALIKAPEAAATLRRPASSISTRRAAPEACGKRSARAASTSLPGIPARASTAAFDNSSSAPAAISIRTGTQEAFPTRCKAAAAALRAPSEPFFAIASTAGITASSRRSARAPTSRPCRSGAAPDAAAARASVTSRPGSSRAVVNPMLNIPLSADLSCSTSRGIPSDRRARIAPRVASMILCLGAADLRTRSYSSAALSAFPPARARSAQRMHPSATAERTAAGASPSDFCRTLAAASLPIRPRAAAAADATSGSASSSRPARLSTARWSRRTPIELITPTSRRPWSFPIASRRASSASGPGIASKAIRAHEASSASESSAASGGTASAVP